MNCRDFILEFEERAALTETARLHLNDCPGCRKNSVVQTHIWETIDGFSMIDAPKNFDFSVKARIAQGQPVNFQPKFLPILRYVLPFSAIVLVVGLLAFNTSIFFGGDSATQVAQVTLPAPTVVETASNNFAAPVAGNNSVQSLTDENVFAETANRSVKTSDIEREIRYVAPDSARRLPAAPHRTASKDDVNGGGSRVSASTTTRVLTPPEFTPRNTPEITANGNGSQPFAINNIWSFIGIETSSENGRQTVKSVKPNGLAARVKIKVGDVIDAVDGVKLSAAPPNKTRFAVKSLTILRGTEKMEIPLQN